VERAVLLESERPVQSAICGVFRRNWGFWGAEDGDGVGVCVDHERDAAELGDAVERPFRVCGSRGSAQTSAYAMSNEPPHAPSQLERIEQYFGASAREWQDLYARPQRVNDLVLANRRRLAVEKLRAYAGAGARVLDAGCGAGLVALDLVEQGFFVQGVDIAQNMLDLAAERFKAAGVNENRYALLRADVTHSALRPASFGAVVALGFLEYQAEVWAPGPCSPQAPTPS
jgi:hypothetical protein